MLDGSDAVGHPNAWASQLKIATALAEKILSGKKLPTEEAKKKAAFLGMNAQLGSMELGEMERNIF